jgi:hypothetical protein
MGGIQQGFQGVEGDDKRDFARLTGGNIEDCRALYGGGYGGTYILCPGKDYIQINS